MRKPVMTAAEAVADVQDGSVVLAGGFGGSGYPLELFEALADAGVKNLTLVSNNAGQGEEGAARLVIEGCVDRLICTYPLGARSQFLRDAVDAGRIEVSLVPQGTLAEAIRAGGAGLGGVLTRTGLGTEFAEGRETVTVQGVEYLLEPAVRGDLALVRAHQADAYGNLRYRYAQQNFNPFVATAARCTIAFVDELVPGSIDPNSVHTPGVFVDRIVVGGNR